LLVFINTVNQTITICDKHVKIYDLADVDNIIKNLDNSFLYVTEVISATKEDVINLINSNFNYNNEEQTAFVEEKYYIHSKNKQKVFVNYDGKEYMFKGCYDFWPLEDLPKNMITECRVVVELLKNGLLEVITETEKQKLLNEQKLNTETKKSRIKISNLKSKATLDDPIEIDVLSKD
jgi:hypothetical protein